MGKLTEAQIRAAKGKKDAYRMPDGEGLQLYVSTKGLRTWQMRFFWGDPKKEQTLKLGHYPELGLKGARDARDAAQSLVRQGKDPRLVKAHVETTFNAAAMRWKLP